MADWTVYLQGLAAMLCLGFLAWLLSLRLNNVAVVDSVWSLFFLLAALVYDAGTAAAGSMHIVVMVLVAVWSVRLSLHLSVRNWGKSEDRRYQAIRARNQPRFAWTSLYLVFGLQAVLAWIVSLPLFAALSASVNVGALGVAGAAIVAFGIIFESVADYQLVRFTKDPGNHGKVLQQGLWRYSRHPNYFGEFCVWWGFYLVAVSAGAWWSLPGPVLMSVLLLRVSGVALLESDIGERRPAYRDYAARTSAFLPLPPRSSVNVGEARS